MDQRRGDALGALGHGVDWLTCGCDNLGCTAAGLQPSTVIVHVITHQDSLSDDTPTQLDGKEEPAANGKPLHPDGTITWTSPRGQTYSTHPGSRILFPDLCRPTAPVVRSDIPETATPGRALAMPRRRQTRVHNRAQAINDERRHNRTIVEAEAAERNRPPPF
jgi:hypothetical protein